MRHAQEIFDRLWVDARESDEDARVVFIVRGGVVDVRLFCDERVTVGEIAVNGERIGLCRLVYRDAGKPATVDFERRRSPGSAGCCVRELQLDLADGLPGDFFHTSQSGCAGALTAFVSCRAQTSESAQERRILTRHADASHGRLRRTRESGQEE